MSVTGSCLCGGVSFTISGEMPPGVACHCSQCRKQSGHHWASVHVAREALEMTSRDGLVWYSASDKARRGFCETCGSTLFWDPVDEDRISVSLGVLDNPTGAKLAKHIFTTDKGDYYEITDGLAQS